MTDHVVVVGASLGGLRVTETLRTLGFGGSITLIGQESCPPYNRPLLSKDVLRTRSEERIPLVPRLRDDVVWRLGTTAVAADLDAQTVTTDDGAQISFDALVVATGLRPRRLPLPGADAGTLTVRNLDDARRLAARAHAAESPRGIVIGAGFLGCEIAASLTTVGCPVTVVAPETTPMVAALGRELGESMRAVHESHGVTFRLEQGVDCLDASGTDTRVVLSDGSTLHSDLVVEAVGSVPNTEWLSGNGLDLGDGVLCDSSLRAVGRDNVLAVGDLARFPNRLFDDTARRVEHWSTAIDSGRHAAEVLHALLGGGAEPGDFMALPTFWTDQYDVRLQAMGMPALGTGDVRLLHGEHGRAAVYGYYDSEGQMVGLAGRGMVRELLSHRADLLTHVEQPQGARISVDAGRQ